MLHFAADFFAYSTSAIGLSMATPQLLRTLRTRSAAGVSVGGMAASSTAYMIWLVYGLHQHQLVTVIAMGIPGVLQGSGALAAWRFGGDRRALYTPAVMIAVLGSVLAIGGWKAFALGLLTTAIWAYAPSIYSSWTAVDTRGISFLAWILSGSYGFTWLAYGVLLKDPIIIASGIINAVLAASVVAALLMRPEARG